MLEHMAWLTTHAHQADHPPAKVPAVLDTPMSMPAWAGAMSMWFTENPPRANAAEPKAAVVAATPARVPCAAAMASSAAAAPQNPATKAHSLQRALSLTYSISCASNASASAELSLQHFNSAGVLTMRGVACI